MDAPVFHGARSVAPTITHLASTMPVPGLGALAVNSYLIGGQQPVLVDAGVPALADQTMAALGSVIDPADIRWIWLTHADADHVGALDQVLAAAPRARVVTNYLGMGKLLMRYAIGPERFYLINPGQSLDVGDGQIEAVSLPSYDAPETMGLFDRRSRALFSSDAFGALLTEEDSLASVDDARGVKADRLAEGLAAWAMVDAPWLTQIEGRQFRHSLERLLTLEPEWIVGSHLPPARGLLPWLATQLDAARSATPFIGPDQAVLEAMFAQVS